MIDPLSSLNNFYSFDAHLDGPRERLLEEVKFVRNYSWTHKFDAIDLIVAGDGETVPKIPQVQDRVFLCGRHVLFLANSWNLTELLLS